MKHNRSEKEARLRKKAEKIIQDYLAWEESHPQPNLTQIEDVILQLRKELGQEMARMLLEEQEARTPAPGPSCRQCGQEMRYKGQKGHRVESRVGSLKLERGHYCCPDCQESVFPPG
jgi:hypothetical protein